MRSFGPRSCPYGGPADVCNDVDRCFRCDDDEHEATCSGDDPECRTCKLRSLQVSPAIGMASRGRKCGPLGFKANNSWERGIVTDDRGMPLLHPDTGDVIGTKQYSEERHRLEAARRTLANQVHAGPVKE